MTVDRETAIEVRRIRREDPYVRIVTAVREARWKRELRRGVPAPWTEVDYDTATCERDGFTVRFHVEREGAYSAVFTGDPWEPYEYDEALRTVGTRGAHGYGAARGQAPAIARRLVDTDRELRERAESVMYEVTVSACGRILGGSVLGDTVDPDDMYVLEYALREHGESLVEEAIDAARAKLDEAIGDTSAMLDALTALREEVAR
jgi:hypothetical protein